MTEREEEEEAPECGGGWIFLLPSTARPRGNALHTHAAGDSDKRKLEFEIFHTNFLYAYTRF